MTNLVTLVPSGADGTDLSSIDSSFVKVSGSGSLGAYSGHLRPVDQSGTNIYLHSTSPASADYSVSGTFVYKSSTSYFWELQFRANADASSYYYLSVAGASFRLGKRIGGANTFLDAGANDIGWGADDVVEFTIEGEGETIRALQDGIEIVSATDSSLTAPGQFGLKGGISASAPSNTKGQLLTEFRADTLDAGSPPSGTVTIGTITHDHDSASIPWTYDAADETGYEYSLDGGAWTAAGTSPLELTGLTPETAYSIEIRAVNASGNGTASTPGTWTTDAAPSNDAPTFDGPNIGAQSGTEGVALTPLDVSGLFSDTDALTYSAIGTWPAGVAVSSAGVISGTPTTAGTYSGLQVRATDTAAQTADSDSFTFTVAAAPVPTITTLPLKNNSGSVLASTTIANVAALSLTDLSVVASWSAIDTEATGELILADDAMSDGTVYLVVTCNADGTAAGARVYTAEE